MNITKIEMKRTPHSVGWVLSVTVAVRREVRSPESRSVWDIPVTLYEFRDVEEEAGYVTWVGLTWGLTDKLSSARVFDNEEHATSAAVHIYKLAKEALETPPVTIPFPE